MKSWKVAAMMALKSDSPLHQSDQGVLASVSEEARCFLIKELEDFGTPNQQAALDLIARGQVPLARDHSVAFDMSRGWGDLDIHDRNHLWTLQQWAFIRPFVHGVLGNKSQDLTTLVAFVRAWMEANLVPAAVERDAAMTWHDHATALRAINAVHLVLALERSGERAEDVLPLLGRFVHVHMTVLLDESFYSRGTNHGFDQAYALFLLGSVFVGSPLAAVARREGGVRLDYEAEIAFNDEGVHIENSPSYHPLMMARAIKARGMLSAFGAEECLARLDHKLGLALSFLTACLRPDGRVPMLGDSDGSLIAYRFEQLSSLPQYPEFLYAATQGRQGFRPNWTQRLFKRAGYLFLRDRWPSPDEEVLNAIHLTMKCGFLSTYHRQDDDNQILLYAYGEDWLIDGGIYKYHETDPYRIYMRSAAAHNILAPNALTPSRVPSAARGTGFYKWKYDEAAAEFAARTNVYPGSTYTRELRSDLSKGRVQIIDHFRSNAESTGGYALRFHVPIDKQIECESDRVRIISGSGSCLTLTVSGHGFSPPAVTAGQTEPVIAGWTSSVPGRLDHAQTITFAAAEAPEARVMINAEISPPTGRVR